MKKYNEVTPAVLKRAQGHPVTAVLGLVSLLDSGETDVVLFRPETGPSYSAVEVISLYRMVGGMKLMI